MMLICCAVIGELGVPPPLVSYAGMLIHFLTSTSSVPCFHPSLFDFIFCLLFFFFFFFFFFFLLNLFNALSSLTFSDGGKC